MLIRVEPKDWAMYAVYFLFNKEQPDPEDGEVEAYLRDHGLEPKRVFDQDYHGVDARVLYFGGCYIRDHMTVIQEIHQRGAQRALLRQELDRVVDAEPTDAVREALMVLDPERLDGLKAAVVERFRFDDSCTPNEEGYLTVAVSDEEIRRAFLELAAAA